MASLVESESHINGKKTFAMKIPSVTVCDLKLRFLMLSGDGIFSNSNDIHQERSQPLFLGLDVLQDATDTKNRGRIYARYISMQMATKLNFSGCRIEGMLRGDSAYFFTIHGLLRVVFEYHPVAFQQRCIQKLLDVWLKTSTAADHSLPLKASYNVSSKNLVISHETAHSKNFVASRETVESNRESEEKAHSNTLHSKNFVSPCETVESHGESKEKVHSKTFVASRETVERDTESEEKAHSNTVHSKNFVAPGETVESHGESKEKVHSKNFVASHETVESLRESKEKEHRSVPCSHTTSKEPTKDCVVVLIETEDNSSVVADVRTDGTNEGWSLCKCSKKSFIGSHEAADESVIDVDVASNLKTSCKCSEASVKDCVGLYVTADNSGSRNSDTNNVNNEKTIHKCSQELVKIHVRDDTESTNDEQTTYDHMQKAVKYHVASDTDNANDEQTTREHSQGSSKTHATSDTDNANGEQTTRKRTQKSVESHFTSRVTLTAEKTNNTDTNRDSTQNENERSEVFAENLIMLCDIADNYSGNVTNQDCENNVQDSDKSSSGGSCSRKRKREDVNTYDNRNSLDTPFLSSKHRRLYVCENGLMSSVTNEQEQEEKKKKKQLKIDEVEMNEKFSSVHKEQDTEREKDKNNDENVQREKQKEGEKKEEKNEENENDDEWSVAESEDLMATHYDEEEEEDDQGEEDEDEEEKTEEKSCRTESVGGKDNHHSSDEPDSCDSFSLRNNNDIASGRFVHIEIHRSEPQSDSQRRKRLNSLASCQSEGEEISKQELLEKEFQEGEFQEQTIPELELPEQEFPEQKLLEQGRQKELQEQKEIPEEEYSLQKVQFQSKNHRKQQQQQSDIGEFSQQKADFQSKDHQQTQNIEGTGFQSFADTMQLQDEIIGSESVLNSAKFGVTDCINRWISEVNYMFTLYDLNSGVSAGTGLHGDVCRFGHTEMKDRGTKCRTSSQNNAEMQETEDEDKGCSQNEDAEMQETEAENRMCSQNDDGTTTTISITPTPATATTPTSTTTTATATTPHTTTPPLAPTTILADVGTEISSSRTLNYVLVVLDFLSKTAKFASSSSFVDTVSELLTLLVNSADENQDVTAAHGETERCSHDASLSHDGNASHDGNISHGSKVLHDGNASHGGNTSLDGNASHDGNESHDAAVSRCPNPPPYTTPSYTTTTTISSSHVENMPFDNPPFKLAALTNIGKWLGREFHKFEPRIAEKVTNFKLQHIDSFGDLPPAAEMVATLFPSCMAEFMSAWLGMDSQGTGQTRTGCSQKGGDYSQKGGEVSHKRFEFSHKGFSPKGDGFSPKRGDCSQKGGVGQKGHSRGDSTSGHRWNAYPVIQLVLELMCNALVSGTAHVVYCKLRQAV